jgi:hypothetical protein
MAIPEIRTKVLGVVAAAFWAAFFVGLISYFGLPASGQCLLVMGVWLPIMYSAYKAISEIDQTFLLAMSNTLLVVLLGYASGVGVCIGWDLFTLVIIFIMGEVGLFLIMDYLDFGELEPDEPEEVEELPLEAIKSPPTIESKEAS